LKKVIFFGAGALACEIFSHATKNAEIRGFISEDNSFEEVLCSRFEKTYKKEFKNHLYKTIEIKNFKKEFDNYFLAVFSPKVKTRVASIMDKFITPISFFHPSSLIDDGSNISPGVYMDAFSSVSHGSKIGRHTLIGRNSNLGHDNSIGNFSSIGPGVVLTRNITIGDGSIIGANSTILPNVSIAKNVTIAPNSLVSRSITEEHSTWIGSIIKRIR